MLDSTLLTPKELHADLVFLQSRGFQSSDLARLHHTTRSGGSVSLAQLIGYFPKRRTLRGDNIDLAVRCHYVAEQVRAGHTNLRSLVSEALAKWPLKRSGRAQPRKKSSAAAPRTAATPRKKSRAKALQQKPRKAAPSTGALARKKSSTTRLTSAAKRRKKR
jgi:hypothetical protein